MIRDVVWACLVCGTENGLDENSVCRTCGARYARGRGANIVVSKPGHDADAVYTPAEVTRLLPHPGTTGSAHCAIRDSAGDWPLYAGKQYLGRIEKLGDPRTGVLTLADGVLRFQPETGDAFALPLLSITAIQPSSHALQIKAARRPVFSIKFTDSSSKLWEERLQAAINEASIAAGQGPVVEFQPRICTQRVVANDSRSFRAREVIDAGRNLRPAMPKLYRFCCWLVRVTWRSLGNYSVTGLEHIPQTGPFLVLPNHQSYIETMLIPAVLPRPIYAMAKSTQFNAPFFGWFMAKIFAYPVRRFEIDPQTVRFMMRRFGEGYGVMVFIEGERTWDGEVQPARLGVGRIALKTGVPVIPCRIEGAFDAWPRWSGKPQSRHVKISFGPPLQLPATASRAEREAFLAESIQRIRNSIDPAHG